MVPMGLSAHAFAIACCRVATAPAVTLALALALALPGQAIAAGDAPPVAAPAPSSPAAASSAASPVAPPAPIACTPESLGGPPVLPLAFPQPWEALRLRFLDGKCALLQGQPARAEAIFRQGMEQDKRVPNLWRFHLLRAQIQLGKSVEALGTLAAVMDDRRPLLQARMRQFLLDPAGGVAGSAGEFDDLATYFVHAAPAIEDYDLLDRLHALAQQRKDDALLRRLPVLLWRLPKDEATAQRWAAALGSTPLTSADWVARQQRLTDLRLTKLVAAELEGGKLPELDPDAARRLGRLYFGALLRDRNYRQAAAQIQAAAVRKRFAFDEREYLTTAIRIDLRRQLIAPALKWLGDLEAAAPQSDALPGIYLDLARYYDQRRDPKPMRRWCTRIVQEHPRSAAASDAYWMLIWDAYAAGDFHRVVTWSGQALENGDGFSADQRARFLYWKARGQDRQGQKEDAEATRAILRDRWPSTYYGLILDPQTTKSPPPAKFGDSAFHPPAAAPPDLKQVWTVPDLADAIFIRAVGEDDVAEALLRQALQQPLPPPVVAELADLFHYAQAHFLAQRLIANQAAGEHARRPVANTPFWRQAYPPAFWDLIKDEAGGQEVSPFFVLAIMREESRFHIKADSRAGAKGLMQLMPATAKELARQEKSILSEDALLSPELNIPLGVRYLRRVLHRFDWNPIYGAAAYNAGPGAVTRWTREWGQLPLDEFVENIPYEETQNYVRRVYASYLIYRQLYR
jgi:soluble lytic murein transglycosylase-like protein